MISGILIIDKPEGITSFGAVSKVKKILSSDIEVKRIGHAGTLDPIATGVLVICLNEATKISKYLTSENKNYHGTLVLGQETDTHDREGEVIKESSYDGLGESDIRRCFETYKGILEQVPPMYSAKKHNGKPLYSFARAGQMVEREPVEVKIYDLKIDNFKPPVVDFFVNCSKGTYVRSLARDIGRNLGCGAFLKDLRRISSGSFHIDEAIRLSDLKQLVSEGIWKNKLITMNEALNLKSVQVSVDQACKIQKGGKIEFNKLADESNNPIKIIDKENRLIALGITNNNKYLQPIKVFNLGLY